MIKITNEITIANLPIRVAKSVNFIYKGVASYSDYKIIFNLPYEVFFPTANTIILP